MYYAIGESYLGLVLVAKTDTGVCVVLIGEDREILVNNLKSWDLKSRFSKEIIEKSFDELAQVINFIENPKIELNIKLDFLGTDFQKKVWAHLQEIPLGATKSYSTIAKELGLPNYARAVALACSKNPIAVLVPCHRVISKNGAISGYRWGVSRKKQILDKEKTLTN